MSTFACFFTDRGVVLLEHYSSTSLSYRLVVELSGDRMVVVKTGGGREEVLVERLDDESLEWIKRNHLAHESDPLAAGAEILLHHTVEEVVACIDGEYWPVQRAIERISRAGEVDWRARHIGILDLWELPVDCDVDPGEAFTRSLVEGGIQKILGLNFPAPWAVRLVAATRYPTLGGRFTDRRMKPVADREFIRARVPYAARDLIQQEAAARGIRLSPMLTLALVDHIAAGRLNVGAALRRAREATFDQLLGYEPV